MANSQPTKANEAEGRAHFKTLLLAPSYWPTWLGFGLLWLLVNALPHRFLMSIGAGLGLLAARFSSRRRKIVARNIALCFPEKSEQAQRALCKAVFKATGRGFLQGLCAWFWPAWRLRRLFKRRVDIEGLEHLQASQAQSSRILLSGHFTCMELGAALVGHLESVNGFYRAHGNAVYEFIQRRGRERHHKDSLAIARDNLKGLVRSIKAGRPMCYFPDQDMGRETSVFADFFGVPAATVTATATLARMTKATLIPYVCFYKASSGRYLLRFLPALTNFPSGKDQASALSDAQRVNHTIEALASGAPEQYLWVHRRFKTRPDGDKDFYRLKS